MGVPHSSPKISPAMRPRASATLPAFSLSDSSYGAIDIPLKEPNSSAGHLAPANQPTGNMGGGLNAVVTLASSCLGAGVLSFPYCMRESGLLVGLMLCLGFGGLLAFSCWTIGYCCHQAQQYEPTVQTYHALVEYVGGTKLAVPVEMIMWFYLFGISLSFCIIIGDIAQPLLSEALGPEAFLSDRANCVGMICLVLVLPLCLLRDISGLTTSSSLAVASVIYVVLLVMTYAIAYSHMDMSNIVMVGDLQGSFTSLPIIGFGLGCHIQVHKPSPYQQHADLSVLRVVCRPPSYFPS